MSVYPEHIDYVVEAIVVEAILEIWERRDQVRGYRFIEQAPWLRHFTAQFEAVSGAVGSEREQGNSSRWAPAFVLT